MIKIIASLLGGNTLAAWAVVALIGVVSLGGAYFYASNQGYQRATVEWSQKYEARELALERQRLTELDRQAQANDRAKASEAKRIAQIRSELADLERQLQEQAHEADNDPDRDRVGLNGDSVRRINGTGRAP